MARFKWEGCIYHYEEDRCRNVMGIQATIETCFTCFFKKKMPMHETNPTFPLSLIARKLLLLTLSLRYSTIVIGNEDWKHDRLFDCILEMLQFFN